MTHFEEFSESARRSVRVIGEPDLTFEADLNSDVFVDTSSFCDCFTLLYTIECNDDYVFMKLQLFLLN